MSTEPEVYCPRCFQVAPPDRVFCSFCGQFIHDNAPPDSRPWDSRPPDLSTSEPEETAAPVAFDIPESYDLFGQSESTAKNPNPASSKPQSQEPDTLTESK